jgi:hypothetical protein
VAGVLYLVMQVGLQKFTNGTRDIRNTHPITF